MSRPISDPWCFLFPNSSWCKTSTKSAKVQKMSFQQKESDTIENKRREACKMIVEEFENAKAALEKDFREKCEQVLMENNISY